MDSVADPRTKAETIGLMEAVCERGNLWSAYERVVGNKGAAGVDGIDRLTFKTHLQQHWPAIKAKLSVIGRKAETGIRR
jgi:retron-type reverse transcriptase